MFSELIDSVENYIAVKNITPVIYNIEIKANPEKDGLYQPKPEDLIKMVMEVIKEKNLGPERYQIQSFDVRQIQEVHENYPYVVTGFLTGNKDKTLKENLAVLGYVPQVYSPNYQLATPELIEKVHSYGMKFVPWTVNELEDMKRLISWGVDGLIAQGAEAGGHLLGVEPALEFATRALEVAGERPVFVAGGIADAADVRAVLDTGAAGAVAGTRFLLTDESAAHPDYKRRVLAATRTVETTLFGMGWPARHRVVENGATSRWLSPSGEVRPVPDRINAIAKVTEVDSLLTKGERWAGFIEAPSA